MNVVIINNGLGNQMSQYAFYLAKRRYQKNCIAIFDPLSIDKHNGSELEKIFGITYESSTKIKILKKIFVLHRHPSLWKIIENLGIRIIKEPINYDFNVEFLKYNTTGINYFVGGWHSERYFLEIRNQITKTFTFQIENELDAEFLSVLSKIRNSKNAVSLHVRRGDYLTISAENPYQLGGVVNTDYYYKAIDKVLDLAINATFFCFSDDIGYCKKTFSNLKIVFVDCNKGSESWRDMFLMTLCKYHINPNSTFSWWGAWLCKDKDSVTICPSKFLLNLRTKDIYPKSWIKIEV